MTGPVVPPGFFALLQIPGLSLREGQSLVARVASRGPEGAASLVIAGELVAARVPEEVEAGSTLRLVVQEISAERVTLRLDPQAPAADVLPSPPPRVTVEERPARGGSGGREGSAVALTYETQGLGRLRLRIESHAGGVAARIEVPPRTLDLARARAPQLREALRAQTGRPAQVEIVPGREAVDLYA